MPSSPSFTRTNVLLALLALTGWTAFAGVYVGSWGIDRRLDELHERAQEAARQNEEVLEHSRKLLKEQDELIGMLRVELELAKNRLRYYQENEPEPPVRPQPPAPTAQPPGRPNGEP